MEYDILNLIRFFFGGGGGGVKVKYCVSGVGSMELKFWIVNE
jgi:hypothetical protein